jgi:hypothetical protein
MTTATTEQRISFAQAILPGGSAVHFAKSALGFAKETRDGAMDLEVGSWIFTGLSILLEGVLAAGSVAVAKETPELGIIFYSLGRLALARGTVFLNS